ncbi:hypothetical protein CICLE_v100214181mg, partial [Citrus x clementina]
DSVMWAFKAFWVFRILLERFSDALPPPRSALLSSFMLPFKPNVVP